MENADKNLTPTEWNLMECLWEHSPRTGREAVEYMAQSVGWSRSTTLTMLRRMSEKGFIDCREEDGVKVYAPLIPREEAVVRETDHFLSRVYQGSISTFMNAFARKQKLTKDEIDALYDIIRTAEEASES
jgi:BlaI family penicillinase repressor